MDSARRQYLADYLRLLQAPGVGAVRMIRLLRGFGSPGDVLAAGAERLAAVGGLKPDQVRWIAGRGWSEPLVEHQLGLLDGCGADFVSLSDSGYPEWLQQIYDPPPVLFVRGDTACLAAPCFGIVGTRGPTRSGCDIAGRTAAELASAGMTVVSGMARGIDSEAHLGALDAGGPTAAVLGCGVDVVYPPENEGLAERIRAAGCIISEYPMGTPPEARNFPRRNRVISGLSRGVLVVEAGIKSGALLTAGYALEQNREVFAVPGDPHRPTSEGANRLIADGARLVQQPADILDELDLLPGRPQETFAAAPAQRELPPLSREERIVYEGLDYDACHVDELADRLGLDVSAVLGILLRLDMKNLVREYPGKLYSLI